MSFTVEAIFLLMPLLMLGWIAFRADRGKEPEGLFSGPRQSDRVQRRDGGDAGSLLVDMGAAGGGDGGNGGDCGGGGD